MLEIIQLPVLTDNYIYLIHEVNSNQTAVIDPAVPEPVIAALNEKGWQLDYILNTHHHSDHTGANFSLKKQTGCKIIGAELDQYRIPGIDIKVSPGNIIWLGNQSLRVIGTPGHTLGHIVYYCQESAALFCGDTLFSLGCGRLFEGNPEQLWHSLQQLKKLPGETQIYCAHEYTQANGQFALTVDPDNQALQQRIHEVEQLRNHQQASVPSTLAQELATNPFLREHIPTIRNRINANHLDDINTLALLRSMKDHFSV